MAMKKQLVRIVNIMNRLNNVEEGLRKVHCDSHLQIRSCGMPTQWHNGFYNPVTLNHLINNLCVPTAFRWTVNEGYGKCREITSNSKSREWCHRLVKQYWELWKMRSFENFRREIIKTSSSVDVHFIVWSMGWIHGKDSLMHVKYEAAVWELIGRCHMIQNLLALISFWRLNKGLWGNLVCDAREDHYKAVSKMGLWKNLQGPARVGVAEWGGRGGEGYVLHIKEKGTRWHFIQRV